MPKELSGPFGAYPARQVSDASSAAYMVDGVILCNWHITVMKIHPACIKGLWVDLVCIIIYYEAFDSAKRQVKCRVSSQTAVLNLNRKLSLTIFNSEYGNQPKSGESARAKHKKGDFAGLKASLLKHIAASLPLRHVERGPSWCVTELDNYQRHVIFLLAPLAVRGDLGQDGLFYVRRRAMHMLDDGILQPFGAEHLRFSLLLNT